MPLANAGGTNREQRQMIRYPLAKLALIAEVAFTVYGFPRLIGEVADTCAGLTPQICDAFTTGAWLGYGGVRLLEVAIVLSVAVAADLVLRFILTALGVGAAKEPTT
jgi:hypothetical protein